jgi:putative transposase
VAVRASRVDDRRVDPATGQRVRFRSVILPPWCRKSPKVAEVLPLLYLHGLSTGDFVPALEAFFGSGAGLSAAAVGRLLTGWQADYQAFCQRDLTERDYVYVWADGVHFRVRLEQARLCCLVIVGVRADGTKELVAVPTASASPPIAGRNCSATSDAAACGHRWWRRRRCPGLVGGPPRRLPRHPPPARLGPQGRQRAGLPAKAVQAGARRALAEIRDALDRQHAERAIQAFARDYGTATTGPSGPRRWPRSSTTPRSCCASSTSRLSIGCT